MTTIERDKIVFLSQHSLTPDLQDQDHNVQDQDQNRIVWSQTGLVLRPMVSDQVVYNSPTGTRVQLVPTWMDWLQLAPENLGFLTKTH